MVTVQFSPCSLLPSVCPYPLLERKDLRQLQGCVMNFKPSTHILGKEEIRERAKKTDVFAFVCVCVCLCLKERRLKEQRKETEGG